MSDVALNCESRFKKKKDPNYFIEKSKLWQSRVITIILFLYDIKYYLNYIIIFYCLNIFNILK